MCSVNDIIAFSEFIYRSIARTNKLGDNTGGMRGGVRWDLGREAMPFSLPFLPLAHRESKIFLLKWRVLAHFDGADVGLP